MCSSKCEDVGCCAVWNLCLIPRAWQSSCLTVQMEQLSRSEPMQWGVPHHEKIFSHNFAVMAAVLFFLNRSNASYQDVFVVLSCH